MVSFATWSYTLSPPFCFGHYFFGSSFLGQRGRCLVQGGHCWRIRMSVWWTSYAGRLNTTGTRVEQGICYVLDQTDKVSSPTGLSIYTQGKRGYTLWLCYESIPLLVNIRLLIMMQYHAILMWLDRYSNTKNMFGNKEVRARRTSVKLT